MQSRPAAFTLAALCSVVSHAAALRDQQAATTRPDPPPQTLERMQWWVAAEDAQPTTDRYLVFTPDIGGPNNIRIGWEMTAVVAKRTGRTLVLPPASPMYLLDFGPRTNWHGDDVTRTATKIEELINLEQLRSMLPVLTAKEFTQKTGKPWKQAKREATQVKDEEICKLDVYEGVNSTFLYMPGDGRREGFSCGEWWKLGGPKPQLGDISDAEWALLTHGFAWHPDAFTIASHAVGHTGIFEYNSLHARYNDFQYDYARQDAKQIFDTWGTYLTGHNSTLYIASDEPDQFSNLNGAWNVVFFRQLFGENTDSDNGTAPLAHVRQQYDPLRWFKMLGPVEELICTYAKVFVGTKQSSFSGHINRMRLHAQAPVTMVLTHTSRLPEAEIEAALGAWTNSFDRKPVTTGNEFLQTRLRHLKPTK